MPAEKTITVSIRSVYGRDTIYPACREALFICSLAGTKTLTEETMRRVVAHGYTVIVEAPSLRFGGR
jgi:hypothetical protein